MSFASTIVVGTDGSATATAAVERAAELAAADGARLVIVTAFHPDERHDGVTHGERAPDEVAWRLTDRNAAEELARIARRAARELGAKDAVVQAVEGKPAEVLLTVAEEFAADLIVVGSVGLTSPARYVLGSVAGSIAHHAPCDVLIVDTT